jgi:hypothetical protein
MYLPIIDAPVLQQPHRLLRSPNVVEGDKQDSLLLVLRGIQVGHAPAFGEDFVEGVIVDSL